MNRQINSLAAIAGLLAFAGSAAAQITLEKVIKNTDATGIAGTSWLASGPFTAGSIDTSGKVAFRGTLATGGTVTSSNNTTGFYGAPGSLNLFARTGSPAPGLSGVNLTGFTASNMPLSPNGNLWFGGSTAAPNGYIATGTPGSLAKVARNGEILTGATLALNQNPANTLGNRNVNNAAQTVFGGQMTDFSLGVWVGSPGSIQLAYKTGVHYAGLPGTTTVQGLTVDPYLNGAGTVVGGVFVNPDGVTVIPGDPSQYLNNEILFTRAYNSSSLTPIARTSDVAPGSGGAQYIAGSFDSGLGGEVANINSTVGNTNNSGHVIFGSGLMGAGVTANNNAGTYYYDGSGANLFRRRGDFTTAVAGATLNLVASSNFGMRLNNNDQVAWTAGLTVGTGGVISSNASVLLQTTLGSASDTLVARQGSKVPVVDGALWGTFSNVLQNNLGQIVFQTTMVDDPTNPNNNVTAANAQALFVWDPANQWYALIARGGDNLASIGINTILSSSWLSIYANPNAEGGADAFTDNGWLTFRVTGTGTDTSAIVRTLVPAPGTGALALLGLAGLARRRRAVR